MTSGSHSLRHRLSVRFAATMAFAVAAISIVTLLVLRETLDRELNANILSVASIQAASVTDPPDGMMHFHEWDLTPEEAESVRDLNRYAQVWNHEGESLLRSQYITEDLPLDPMGLATAEAGSVYWSDGDFHGIPIRSLYYPLARQGPSHTGHVLQIAAPLEMRNAMLLRSTLALLGVSLVVVLGSFFGSRWIGGTVVRPVDEIIDQVEAIEAGSPTRIDAYAEYSEYERLLKTLNTMLGRLQQAYDGQRRFTADASHELRTPLTVLRGEMEIALRRPRPPEEYRNIITSNLEEVLRLAQITEELLLLAKADGGYPILTLKAVELSDVLESVYERFKARAEERGLRLTFEPSVGTELRCDPVLAAQVCSNLVENSLKFTPAGGRVLIRTGATADEVAIVVEDSGPGLGPDPERLFERFHQDDDARTSPDGVPRGAGLGLSIITAIAEAHGGTVLPSRSPLGGASISVSFPREGAGIRAGLVTEEA